MKPFPSSEHDERDQEIIDLLKDLGHLESTYPPELLAARRAAFLTQVEELSPVDGGEELSAADQEVVKLLGQLKSAQAEYPAELLAARRSAFLRQIETTELTSVLDRFRASVQRIFRSKTTTPILPSTGFRRISLFVASLIAAVLIGSLFFSRAEQAFQPITSQADVEPLPLLPTNTGEVALIICKPDDQTPSCQPEELDPSQDLADQGNGAARPAVAKDARSGQGGVHTAAYVNDGRAGASWVSNSADSWIKIDLGKVTTINTVSLRKGSVGPSNDSDPGQFGIAVALSDVYEDGHSSNDYVEYAQVFSSEQTGFSGRVSHTETIRTEFPPVRARFVKITFERAGAAIEEVGVFMVQPRVPAEQATRTPRDEVSETTSTPLPTNTGLPIATQTAPIVPTGTRLPTHTSTPTASNTSTPLPTSTRPPTDTPTPLATNTQSPADTSTPVPTDPVPSNTPVPLSLDTPVPLPSVVPPTVVPPILQPPPASTETIVVTGSDQTLTFTCNGNAAEIRGHSNTVTLLGSCSSINVTGNGNRVFWQSGSPVITNRGRDNIISQL